MPDITFVPAALAAVYMRNVVMEEDGCWGWTGQISHNGYGRVDHKRKHYFAHRVSYVLWKGRIPDGLQIRHLCHNPPCTNPDHLTVGTAKQNSQDSVQADRRPRGESNPNSRLSADQVAAIREDPRILRLVAADYGVSLQTISVIRRGKTWKR